MAHIDVHRIEAIAARRSARLAQVEALAPFPARAPLDPWSPWRRGYRHATPVAVGGRLGDVYLGEEIPSSEPGGEPSVRPPAAERSPNIGALPRDVPAQLCYALTIRGRPPAPNVAGASTPPLPWPAQIVGASLHWNHLGIVTGAAWGLWVTTDEWTSANNTITGESLVQLVQDDVPEISASLQQNAVTPIPLLASTQANDNNSRDAATALIGGIIRAAGLRLTLVLSANIDQSSELVLVVTLRQLIEERAPTVLRERAAPAPRPATAARVAPRLLPRQAPPPPIVPGGWLMPPTGITPIFGFQGTTKPTSPPSQAVALQMIWAGRAPVTVPFRVGPGDTAIAAGTPGFESLRQAEARRALERAQPLISTTF